MPDPSSDADQRVIDDAPPLRKRLFTHVFSAEVTLFHHRAASCTVSPDAARRCSCPQRVSIDYTITPKTAFRFPADAFAGIRAISEFLPQRA